MPNFSRRAERRLEGRLGPGESFVFAAVVQPSGSVSRELAIDQRLGIAVWNALKIKRSEGDTDSIAARAPTSNGYLAATSRRLIWLDQGGTGFPTDEIVTTFEAAEVLGADWKKAGRMGQQSVVVAFSDGSTIDLWVHRSNKPDRLVEAINALMSNA